MKLFTYPAPPEAIRALRPAYEPMLGVVVTPEHAVQRLSYAVQPVLQKLWAQGALPSNTVFQVQYDAVEGLATLLLAHPQEHVAKLCLDDEFSAACLLTAGGEPPRQLPTSEATLMPWATSVAVVGDANRPRARTVRVDKRLWAARPRRITVVSYRAGDVYVEWVSPKARCGRVADTAGEGIRKIRDLLVRKRRGEEVRL